MMKRLAVPLFRQPTGKPWCGPTCASMILAYYGIPKSAEEIAGLLPMKKTGINPASLGIFFIENGFDVVLKLWYKNRFPNNFAYSGKINFRKLLKPATSGTRKEHAQMRKLIRLGGRIIPGPVSLPELQTAIKNGFPPILNLCSAALLGYPRWDDFGHYVVPVSYSRTTMTLNDPSARYGGINTYPSEFVMYACYTWSAGALFIRPKK